MTSLLLRSRWRLLALATVLALAGGTWTLTAARPNGQGSGRVDAHCSAAPGCASGSAPVARAIPSPSTASSPTATAAPPPSPTPAKTPPPTLAPGPTLTYHPATPTPAPSPSPTPAPTPTPTPPGAVDAACPNPSFVTSDPFGGENSGGYYLYNNEWNASHYQVTQTLGACGFDNWYVVANMNNSSGDGAVKTYPCVQMNYPAEPRISSFASMSSTFAETDPHVGIYEDAYDIWVNGVASATSTEIMIWNNNHNQVPAGSAMGTVTLSGHTFTVWRSGSAGHYYIAFVADTNFTSGTLDILGFFQWVTAQGWITTTATLGSIQYGAELVSTDGTNQTFTFRNFSVTTT